MSITSRGQSTDSGRKPSGPGAWRFATSFPGPRPLYQANLDQAAPEQGWSALPCAAVILGRSELVVFPRLRCQRPTDMGGRPVVCSFAGGAWRRVAHARVSYSRHVALCPLSCGFVSVRVGQCWQRLGCLLPIWFAPTASVSKRTPGAGRCTAAVLLVVLHRPVSGAWPGGLRPPQGVRGRAQPRDTARSRGAVWLRLGLDELPGTSTFTSVAVVAGGHPVLVAGGVVAARV